MRARIWGQTLTACIAYRTVHQNQEAPVSTSPKVIYHTLFPHPALSPAPINDVPTVEQLRNEAAYRQLLVGGVLAILLPTEDLRNPCLRTLVTDVIADMILGTGVGGKASEAWLIYDGLVKVLERGRPRAVIRTSGVGLETDTRSQLERFGLVVSKEKKARTNAYKAWSGAFWRIAQYCYMTFVAMRFALFGLLAASSAPRRDEAAVKKVTKGDGSTAPIAAGVEAPPSAGKRPLLTYSIFGVLSQLLELPRRMPWTHGFINLVQWQLTYGVLQVGATNGLLDV